MRSTNPVFSRSEQFATQSAYTQQQFQQNPYAGYGQPGFDQQAPWGQQPAYAEPAGGRMTIDDVITKSAITMGVLVVAAALTFMFLPASLMMPAVLVSGIVGFVAVLFVSMRRTLNPAFVLAYSVFEGVFIGAFSLLVANIVGDAGIVVQAVVGTFVAAGATLAAYKYLRIKVTSQFRKIVTTATFAFLGLVLVNFVLALFGIDMGIRGIGGGVNLITIAVSLLAIVLAVANLIMDFDFIEQGIRNSLPASESWRAALGLTVTMVWLYTELLRVLSYFRSN